MLSCGQVSGRAAHFQEEAYPIIHKHLALLFPFGLRHTDRRNLVQLWDSKLLFRVDALLPLLEDVGDLGPALDALPWDRGLVLVVLLRLDNAVALLAVLGLLAALDAAPVGGVLVLDRPCCPHLVVVCVVLFRGKEAAVGMFR